MTQYAYFDSTVAAPSPVLGWYDTDEFAYPNLPTAANLCVVPVAQWDARLSNPSGWAVSNGAIVAYTPLPPAIPLATQARAALNTMDGPGGCAIRCYKAGVAFPADWQAYCLALRAIANGASTATVLPVQPPYPAGT
jgi:hypothetical protein